MMNATTAREMTATAIANHEARMREHAEDIANWIEREFIKPAASNGEDAIVVSTYDVHNRFYWEAELAFTKAIDMLKDNGFTVYEHPTRNGIIYKVSW